LFTIIDFFFISRSISLLIQSFLLSFLLVQAGCVYKTSNHDYPNIVIIYADDMGFGDAQCYNSKSLIPTPNIDQMAASGMLFTDAHSSSAVCTPSRYSLLTGRYAWRTSLQKHVLWPWEKPLIDTARLTLPEMLQDKGYQTAAVGKWHLGWEWPTVDSEKVIDGTNIDYTQSIEGGPLDHGFNFYFGDDVPNFPPYTFIENEQVTEVPTMMKPDSLFGDQGMMVEGWDLTAVMPKITSKAIEYINKFSGEDKPFFLYFALTAPHTPIAPLEKYKGKSKAGLYGDFVCEVDSTVGKIIQAIEENEMSKNTLLIFTSDNGSPGRDGENWSGEIGSVKAYGHLPNCTLRGYKGDIWEAGHRIPFIVKWPDKVKSGMTNKELICQVDIMRTIAEIIDYELPDNAAEDSYNLLPALLQNHDEFVRKDLIHHSWNGSFAIRQGDWKLIMTESSGGFRNHESDSSSTGQLYNLKSDLEESNNLYNSFPEKVDSLKQLLAEYKLNDRSTKRVEQLQSSK